MPARDTWDWVRGCLALAAGGTDIRSLCRLKVTLRQTVQREPVWPSRVRRYWLVSGRTSVRYRFGSPFSSKVVVCGHGLVTLSLTINETLKWLSSLPILMQVILVVKV